MGDRLTAAGSRREALTQHTAAFGRSALVPVPPGVEGSSAKRRKHEAERERLRQRERHTGGEKRETQTGMAAQAPVAGLTWEQKMELFADGFTVLRNAVPLELVARAKAAIDGTGATAVQPGEKVEFEQINLNQRARKAGAVSSSAEITDLFNKSAIRPTLEAAIGNVPPAQVPLCPSLPLSAPMPPSLFRVCLPLCLSVSLTL
eukprot:COSAG03_NODE_240_length_10098_cov_71.012101_3_plen_204_part_00